MKVFLILVYLFFGEPAMETESFDTLKECEVGGSQLSEFIKETIPPGVEILHLGCTKPVKVMEPL